MDHVSTMCRAMSCFLVYVVQTEKHDFSGALMCQDVNRSLYFTPSGPKYLIPDGLKQECKVKNKAVWKNKPVEIYLVVQNIFGKNLFTFPKDLSPLPA